MNQKLSPRRRALSLLLALTLILGLLPGSVLAAEAGADTAAGASAAPAGHWAASYLNQMVEWGFIRADQAQNPDRQLTRADFMSIVNRAYGYHETGETPFEDVSEYDWFYDDVGIAYTAKYINGTSPTTASPNDALNRETAATILGRNMMLQESPGELMDFSDARNISNWARGTIKSSMEHYLVTGYNDGTFRPQKAMTWGEIAAMVTRTVGTPLQDAGDYALGGVFGNVTITSPGVTLRDTVISGDLYVTGGVGLGGVTLENVTVLGRIIASGTGSSEGGASILLRNVTADELLVDNLQDKEVSIQADGITEIGKTTVRSSAYIEDNTPDGMGLHMISLEGDFYGEDEEPPEGWEPPQLTLAGRVEEVVNRTPDSTVHAAKGTVAKLTVDETAEGSNVVIDRGAVVKNLILDTGVEVTGEGDITRLEVNAPGCDVEMLPDQIVIRPGITAVIAGNEMDSASAEEFLLDPMILSGYPKAQDIAPTSLEAVFATNKQGRIYWAVSAVTDGSIGAEDLLKPPSYGNKAVRWGTIDSPRGNEEVTAQITGLTSNGTYYLSALLEDAKGQLSPVKVISFTTPDNTVPAFNTGYPRMSKTSPKDSVVVVSANKSCKLYYALMPEGATAPTENELKTNAVAGALGYGVRDVQKNVEDTFRVNDQLLEEKTNYILYLWLVDADGANKSAVTPLPFTTDDETPPEFIMGPEVNSVQATSVGLRFRLNEAGTVYWVAVPAGTVYPKPEPGTEYDRAPLTSDYAKLQVYSGMNLGTDGKSGQVTALENVDGTITVAGLQPETAYDFYYVAKDNAGPDRNYSVTVGKMTINTLDDSGPKFTQHFSKHSGTDDTIDPKSDTDIFIDVSENIRYAGDGGGRGFLELYNDVATGGNAAVNKLASNLAQSIWLCKSPSGSSSSADQDRVPYISQVGQNVENWVIDYTKATVTARTGGSIRITFPAAGLQLENGAEYYFVVRDVTDTSNNMNPLENPAVVDFKHDAVTSAAAGHDLRPFTVEPATVLLYEPGGGMLGTKATGGTMLGRPTGIPATDEGRILFFRMDPDSTDSSIGSLCYDMLLWSDSKVSFNLYYRIVDENGNPGPSGTDETYSATTNKANMLPSSGGQENRTPDANGWIKLNGSSPISVAPSDGSRAAASLNRDFNNCASSTFPKLNSLRSDLGYEFVIELRTYEGNEQHETWTEPINFYINFASGQSSYLFDLARQMRQRPADNITMWDDFLNNRGTMEGKGGKSIGRTNITNTTTPDTLHLSWPLDTRLPRLNNNPIFTPSDTSVDITIDLDVKGTVKYAIARARTSSNNPAVTITRNRVTGDESITGTGPINVTMDVSKPPDSGEPLPLWQIGGGGTEDVPRSDNAITNPTRYAVQNMALRPAQSGETVVTGSFECNGVVVGTDIAEGLTPDTDYFIYFITEGDGGGEPSHVYIYHFKTEITAPIKIQSLVPNSGTGDANAVTNVNGYLSYRVFNSSEAKNAALVQILNDPMSSHLTAGMELPDVYAYSPTETNADGSKKEMTVLEALTQSFDVDRINQTTYPPNGTYYPIRDDLPDRSKKDYTVFDVYADRDTKRMLYDMIWSGRTSGYYTNDVEEIDAKADMQITGGRPTPLNLQHIIPGGEYIVVAMARSQDSNAAGQVADIYAFRAAERVGVIAQDAPVINSVVGKADPHNSAIANAKYFGNLVVTFSDLIYWRPSPLVRQLPAAGGPAGQEGPNQAQYPNILTNAIALGGNVEATITGTPPVRVFTFSFENMESGGTLTIPSQNICNRAGNPVDYGILITFNETKTQSGTSTTTTFTATVTLNYDDGRVVSRPPITLYTRTDGFNMFLQDDPRVTSATDKAPLASSNGYSLKMTAAQSKAYLEALLQPEDAAYNVSWESNNTNVVVARPTKNDPRERTATIEACGIGTAIITVSVGNGLASQTIEVTVEGQITLNDSTLTTSGITIPNTDATGVSTFTFTLPSGLEQSEISVQMANGTGSLVQPEVTTSGGTRTVTVTRKSMPPIGTSYTDTLKIMAGGKEVASIPIIVNGQSALPGGGSVEPIPGTSR